MWKIVAVGLLWGATNPFLRRAARNDVVTRYWIPLILNQLGSVLFVYALQSSSISIAVPIANSLSFAFTAITGYLLGEKIPGRKVVIGTLLICIGSALMI